MKRVNLLNVWKDCVNSDRDNGGNEESEGERENEDEMC